MINFTWKKNILMDQRQPYFHTDLDILQPQLVAQRVVVESNGVNPEISAQSESGVRRELPLYPLADKAVPGVLFQAASNLERNADIPKNVIKYIVVFLCLLYIISVCLSYLVARVKYSTAHFTLLLAITTRVQNLLYKINVKCKLQFHREFII